MTRPLAEPVAGARLGRLLVVVGVRHEARALGRGRAARAAGSALAIRTAGPGAGGLARIEAELDAGLADALLVTGLAGGCAPGLRAGHLVVADRVGPTAAGEWLAPDAGLRRQAAAALAAARLPYRSGGLLTAPAVVATPAAKQACWRQAKALAVDLESAHVVAWAARVRVPVVVVRAVADGPEETLPPALAEAVDAEGRLRPAVVAAWAARPALARSAFRLWRRSRVALRSLDRFLAVFLRAPFRP